MRVKALAGALLLAPGLAAAQPFTFVSTPASDSLAVVDLSSNTVVGTVPVPGLPSGCAVGPHERWVFAVRSQANALARIEIATGAITSIPVGAGPSGVALSRAGRRVYVANTGSDTVSVVDPFRAMVVATVAVGEEPLAVLVGGQRVYVANWGSNTVSVIDTGSNAVVGTVDVGRFPAGLAFHRGTGRLYVANFFDDTVSVIDTQALSVVQTIAVARGPRALELDARGRRLFVAGFEAGRVQAIDTATGAVALDVDSGGENPLDLLLGPDGAKLYVAHIQETQGVVVLDAATLAPITTVDVPAGPVAFSGVAARRPVVPLEGAWARAARGLARALLVPPGSIAAPVPGRSAARGVEDIVITDTEFPNADWQASGPGKWTVTQDPTGGNPTAWRRVTHFGPANTVHVLVRPGAAYDPAQGPIQTIDVSWDRRLLAESVALEGFLVQQNNVIYRTTERAIFLSTWQSDSRAGLVAADFQDTSSGSPDFTADGAPIRFGFFRRTTTGQTLGHGIDNFVVTVHPLGTNLAGTLGFEKSLIVVKEHDTPFISVARVGGTQGAIGAEVLVRRPDGSSSIEPVQWTDGDGAPRSLLILGLDLPAGAGARTARLSIQNVAGGASVSTTRGDMSIAVIPLNWGPALELLYLRLLGLLSAFSPAWLLALAAPAALLARRARRG